MTTDPRPAPSATALEEHLRLLHQLGLGGPDPELDAVAARLAEDAQVPYAMINIFDPATGVQHFMGLASPTDGDLPTMTRTMAPDWGFCPEVARTRTKPLPLPDVYAKPRFAGNPVVDRLGIRTYTGAPLIHEETQTVLGTVCFVGPEAMEQSTGQRSLALIKAYRDEVMQILHQRAARIPQ
ncbi:GAF domain-containing protein [Streptomyces sp. NPDC050485]|uniref:GAF domain-containing protein n=1 Tax=Streptomyces sp. NPDC050485 TaxID=3365617 RepID=UPI003793AC75